MKREKVKVLLEEIGSRQLYTVLFFKMGKITCVDAKGNGSKRREGKIDNVGNIILEIISRAMSSDRWREIERLSLDSTPLSSSIKTDMWLYEHKCKQMDRCVQVNS